MTLPGETLGVRGTDCGCGRTLRLCVCHGRRGHYLGYFCPKHGPVSRESAYIDGPELAADLLQQLQQGRELPDWALRVGRGRR
jgi:hypothetical protein